MSEKKELRDEALEDVNGGALAGLPGQRKLDPTFTCKHCGTVVKTVLSADSDGKVRCPYCHTVLGDGTLDIREVQ